MKRDLAIGITCAVIAGAICYALATTRPNLPPRLSHPFSAVATSSGAPNERVVMHVNGEPVSESEFVAFYHQLPPELQQQYASEVGKQTLGEQLVRMKLLEQEARRLGVDRDPNVVGQLKADQANVLANAAAEKLISQPTEQAVRDFYIRNKMRFEAVNVSHILIAYSTGSVPARHGSAPPLPQAQKKAQAIYDQLKAGADFATTARNVSDDATTAQGGGALGPISHGMLPGELDAQVFSTQPGQITQPLTSKFGIHIFRVNSREAQPLDQLRQGIAQRVRQQSLLDRVEKLRKTAKVDFDPKFFPPPKKNPS